MDLEHDQSSHQSLDVCSFIEYLERFFKLIKKYRHEFVTVTDIQMDRHAD